MVKFKSFALVFAQILWNYVHWSLANGSYCITPDNVPGACIPTEYCERITFLLSTWQAPFPQHVVDYVRASHCGEYGGKHYACCAGHSAKIGYQNQNRKESTTTSVNPFHRPAHHNVRVTSAPPTRPPTTTYTYGQNSRPTLGETILNSMPCGYYGGDRIANGEVVRLSEFPWMALIEYENEKSRKRFKCAGTLITDRYVLTAAHCVVDLSCIGVRLGEHNLNTLEDCQAVSKKHKWHCAPPHENFGIERIIPHAQYSLRPLRNDIALIRLNRPVRFQSNIKPVCLPRSPQLSNNIPQNLIISGWGQTERGYASDVLLKAMIPLKSIDVCAATFRRNLQANSDHICAGGGEGRRISCRGDSGGPLFAAVNYENTGHIKYVQYGIVSAGAGSCGGRHNFPGIYTAVAAHMDWIVNNLEA